MSSRRLRRKALGKPGAFFFSDNLQMTKDGEGRNLVEVRFAVRLILFVFLILLLTTEDTEFAEGFSHDNVFKKK